jgi:hypothetical protein
MNIYVGQKYWAPNQEVEEAVAEVAEEVAEDVAVAEVMEEAAEEETAPPMLPTTAGPLPWLALFGSLFLLIGGALRFSRKQ